MAVVASVWIKDRAFEALATLDDWLHDRGFKPGRICRLVGRWEIAYYERGIDWDNPIYVRDVQWESTPSPEKKAI